MQQKGLLVLIILSCATGTKHALLLFGRHDESIDLICLEYRINFLSLPRKYEFNRGQGQSLSLLIYRHNVRGTPSRRNLVNFTRIRDLCVRLCYALS